MLTPRRSWPVGGERALVRLESGEYVCVDLRSLDSYAYLLGWDLEGDVVAVFHTFLTPRSVVVREERLTHAGGSYAGWGLGSG